MNAKRTGDKTAGGKAAGGETAGAKIAGGESETASATASLLALLQNSKAQTSQHGAKRFSVSRDIWRRLAGGLGRSLDLMGLWTDDSAVHMALFDPATGDFAIASLDLVDAAYPSIGRHHAAAIRLERSIFDLCGVVAEGQQDTRPWIDHGKWPLKHPLSKSPGEGQSHEPYAFLAAEGEGLHQIPVGPVHAGIIEPGHFRFNCAGETVVRLEARLGYTHKGIEKLLEGKSLNDAARICARISGDSTVAYSVAFARAAEAALAVEIPERAHWLRALMSELERLANHLGDIGAICNDAAFALMHAHCGILREDVLQASKLCFGHRLMMDCALPGGVACDIAKDGEEVLKRLLRGIDERLPRLVNLYYNTPSLMDRTRNTGYLDPDLAASFAAGGFVGRASGRRFDARQAFGIEPYRQLSFDVAALREGDVNARVWIRIEEAQQSLALIGQILRQMPQGAIKTALPAGLGETREGVAVVEGFRGDILLWLRLDESGQILRCHPRDPSVFQWPLLEAVIENNIVADFPLCNKSFNCSYSGHDL